MASRIHGIKLKMLNKLVSQFGNRLFHSNPSTIPWLFVGLGNPGDKFKGTRHNIGFEMIDAFAASQDIRMDSLHFKAVFGKGLVEGVPVFLAKPHTYMNRSGSSSGPLAAYYKLPLDHVLVIHDDLDLPCGVLRLDYKQSHRKHDGLNSVTHHFRRSGDFPRLRIGIGTPHRSEDPREFVLQKFSATAREQIDAALQEGPDVLKKILSRGVKETVTFLNIRQKYKHLSPIQLD